MKKVRHNKTDQNLMDQDYWNKLSTEDKEWLNQFNKEYYEAIYDADERVHHSKDYDDKLRNDRSSRRKDIFNNNFIGNKDNGDEVKVGIDNDMDVYTSDKGMYYENDELSKLKKIDEAKAMNILEEQAIDAINNDIDSMSNIIKKLQKDSIEIFLNARKNP